MACGGAQPPLAASAALQSECRGHIWTTPSIPSASRPARCAKSARGDGPDARSPAASAREDRSACSRVASLCDGFNQLAVLHCDALLREAIGYARHLGCQPLAGFLRAEQIVDRNRQRIDIFWRN